MNPTSIIELHPNDNVVVAASRLVPGQSIVRTLGSGGSRQVEVCERVDAGHKVAVTAIEPGDHVIKFGNPIGVATSLIRPGSHVHCHNVVDEHPGSRAIGGHHGVASKAAPSPQDVVSCDHFVQRKSSDRRTFMGFDRGDGRVGTRNYVLIAARVNCSATVCHEVSRRFPAERLAEFPNVDGIAIATHTTGCALQYAGDKHDSLGRVLRGYAGHANVAASLMIGLGCEQTTPEYLSEYHQLVQIGNLGETDSTVKIGQGSCDPSDRVGTHMLTMQAEGGTRATIDRAEKQLERLLHQANQFTRTPVSVGHLKVALECGGSDGYSGITANPVVGEVADRVIAHGGAAVLSETPEIYGAEHLLTARAESHEVADRLLAKIRWWEEHVAAYGERINNNPSMGNKAGGLTTISEKSLGAVAKSGQSPLRAVVDYAAPVPDAGLCVMDTPGFDPASVTGKVAGGCNLVLFTTGRGSCFGCKPAPVIKIASNTLLFDSMPEDMDLNAGVILEGETLASVGERFFERLLEFASGEKTCSETLGLGDHEFVPWTVGPTL